MHEYVRRKILQNMCSSNNSAVYHIVNCIHIAIATRRKDLLLWQQLPLERAAAPTALKGIMEYYVFLSPPFFFFNKELIFFYWRCLFARIPSAHPRPHIPTHGRRR